jgi:hypothetical protein
VNAIAHRRLASCFALLALVLVIGPQSAWGASAKDEQDYQQLMALRQAAQQQGNNQPQQQDPPPQQPVEDPPPPPPQQPQTPPGERPQPGCIRLIGVDSSC